MENVSLFEVDENGQLVYEQVDESVNEVFENGNDVDTYVDSGAFPSVEMEDEEILEETQENVVFSLGDGALPVVLSDEVTTAILDAVRPAGGTLSSSTLEYFDRIVSGLPSDFAYVAYRTDSDSNYDGVLYYSDDYTIDGDSVIFEGDGAIQVHVNRVSLSGYATSTEYMNYSAKDVNVNLSRSGDVVYYSNIQHGFPILGGMARPVESASLFGIALAVSLFVAGFTMLFRRFR